MRSASTTSDCAWKKRISIGVLVDQPNIRSRIRTVCSRYSSSACRLGFLDKSASAIRADDALEHRGRDVVLLRK